MGIYSITDLLLDKVYNISADKARTMEASTPQAEFSGQPRPDFYVLILGRGLSETELEAAYSIIEVDDIDTALSKIEEYYPDLPIPGKKDKTLHGEFVAYIVDPDSRPLILRQKAESKI